MNLIFTDYCRRFGGWLFLPFFIALLTTVFWEGTLLLPIAGVWLLAWDAEHGARAVIRLMPVSRAELAAADWRYGVFWPWLSSVLGMTLGWLFHLAFSTMSSFDDIGPRMLSLTILAAALASAGFLATSVGQRARSLRDELVIAVPCLLLVLFAWFGSFASFALSRHLGHVSLSDPPMLTLAAGAVALTALSRLHAWEAATVSLPVNDRLQAAPAPAGPTVLTRLIDGVTERFHGLARWNVHLSLTFLGFLVLWLAVAFALTPVFDEWRVPVGFLVIGAGVGGSDVRLWRCLPVTLPAMVTSRVVLPSVLVLAGGLIAPCLVPGRLESMAHVVTMACLASTAVAVVGALSAVTNPGCLARLACKFAFFSAIYFDYPVRSVSAAGARVVAVTCAVVTVVAFGLTVLRLRLSSAAYRPAEREAGTKIAPG